MNLKKLISPRILVRLAAGLTLFVLSFVLSGPWQVLSAAGRGLWAFGTLAGLSAAALAFRAVAWKIALAQEGRKSASFAAVLIALTAFGGTPVRLAVLKRRTGIADGAGSVVADEAVRSLASLIFAVAGLLFGFLVPGNPLMCGLMVLAAVCGFGYAVVSLRRRKGFFAACAGGLPKRFLSPAVRGKMEERDRFLFRFRAQNRSGFYASLLVHLIVHLFLALEILAVGKAIDDYFPGLLSLGLAALFLIFRRIFWSIPACFGALESAVALVLALTFGLPLAAVGVAIVWVLRLLTLSWWLVGFASAGNPVRVLFGK